MKQAYPSLFEPSLEVNINNFYLTVDVVRVLLASGDKKQAHQIIAEAMQVEKRKNNIIAIILLEASLQALAGNDQQTLDDLSRYLNAGGSP